MKIQLIKSPIGRPYMLAYSAGQLVDFPDKLAERLILDGYALKVPKDVRTTKPAAAETRGVQGDDGASKRTAKPYRGKKLPKGR